MYHSQQYAGLKSLISMVVQILGLKNCYGFLVHLVKILMDLDLLEAGQDQQSRSQTQELKFVE